MVFLLAICVSVHLQFPSLRFALGIGKGDVAVGTVAEIEDEGGCLADGPSRPERPEPRLGALDGRAPGGFGD